MVNIDLIARVDYKVSISGGSKLEEKNDFGLHCKKLDFNIAHRQPDIVVFISNRNNDNKVSKWIGRNTVTYSSVMIYSDCKISIISLEVILLNSQTDKLV